ncbi:MAG: hypothetical protein GY929_08990 [Actinomycetia bacterium]|nr:hypothetical protein [Actinomycetes bacterium]
MADTDLLTVVGSQQALGPLGDQVDAAELAEANTAVTTAIEGEIGFVVSRSVADLTLQATATTTLNLAAGTSPSLLTGERPALFVGGWVTVGEAAAGGLTESVAGPRQVTAISVSDLQVTVDGDAVTYAATDGVRLGLAEVADTDAVPADIKMAAKITLRAQWVSQAGQRSLIYQPNADGGFLIPMPALQILARRTQLGIG